MKHPLLLLFFFIIGFGEMHAQFNNNFWVFGDSCAIKWNDTLTANIGFSSIHGRGTVTSISDSSTILLASQTSYTNMIFNNTKTFNKHGYSISGSDSIIGEGWYHEMIILPLPDSDSLAYIFSIGVTIQQNFGLYYTLINYKANNDSGIVIQKNVQLNNFPAFDGLTAVRHGNGRDWWLVFQRWDPVNFTGFNDFYIYKISPLGINVNIQNIGPMHSTGGGQAVFNNNGDEFLNLDWRGLLSKYSFDRCSGILSNPVTIEAERTAGYPFYTSGAFSPDDTKVYVSAYTHPNGLGFLDTLYQYDLTSANINGSRQVIYTAPNSDVGFGAMKLAPDGKIYLTSVDLTASIPYPDSLYTIYNTHLSVINQPDSLGLACDFQPFSFYLGGARTYYGLPNNPDYELGAWVGSPCDTLTVGINENEEKNDVFFQAWYNHQWNMIHVNASKLKGKSGVLRLFDVEGRVVVEREVEVMSGGYFTGEIAMNGIASGVYIVSLVTEKDKIQGKILKL
ncbi:MAG: hypothetical protein KA347_00565 [Bacteroidia bacterium]|jgi:hypothetical protein|nr:hypothetical protein [Bacteroidota bacterium]MBP6511137.1 hypothetical protein [Bacteroidia bacterium]